MGCTVSIITCPSSCALIPIQRSVRIAKHFSRYLNAPTTRNANVANFGNFFQGNFWNDRVRIFSTLQNVFDLFFYPKMLPILEVEVLECSFPQILKDSQFWFWCKSDFEYQILYTFCCVRWTNVEWASTWWFWILLFWQWIDIKRGAMERRTYV